MKIKLKLCALLGDESGTSLTEFVIVLPVFLIVFSGVLGMYKVQAAATDVKMTAYSQAIDETQQISERLMGMSVSLFKNGDITTILEAGSLMQPVTGAGAAEIYHLQTSSGGRLATNLVLDGFIAGGHMDESWSRVVLPALMEKNLTVYNKVDSLPSMNHELFASAMLDDFVYGWPAIAAGMRYGIGHSDPGLVNQVVVGGKSFQFQQGYHLAAPPEPTSRFLTVGVIRKVLSSSDAWDKHILAFEMKPYSGSGEANPDVEKCIADTEALANRSFSVSDVIPGAKKPTDGLCDGVLSQGGFDFFNGKAKDGNIGGVNPFDDGIKLGNSPF